MVSLWIACYHQKSIRNTKYMWRVCFTNEYFVVRIKLGTACVPARCSHIWSNLFFTYETKTRSMCTQALMISAKVQKSVNALTKVKLVYKNRSIIFTEGDFLNLCLFAIPYTRLWCQHSQLCIITENSILTQMIGVLRQCIVFGRYQILTWNSAENER